MCGYVDKLTITQKPPYFVCKIIKINFNRNIYAIKIHPLLTIKHTYCIIYIMDIMGFNYGYKNIYDT